MTEDRAISLKEAIEAIRHAEVNFSVQSEIDFTKHKREVQEIIDNILHAQEKALMQLPLVNDEEMAMQYQRGYIDGFKEGKATFEPKTGHWIMPQQDDGMSDPIYYQVRCSKCGFDLDPQTWHMELHQYDADKYCPNCGAKMVEKHESEEV